MSDTPEDRDYATAATERLLMKYDENRIPLTHVAQLQRDIRLAILEAMRDQRHTSAEAIAAIEQDQLRGPGDAIDCAHSACMNATVTVKPEEK